ncbi:hypothetical protein GCM10029992_57350 [Glycomyces albus]
MTGIDRKAIPRDLERSYRRNVGFYKDLSGRPIRSKPLFHRDAAIEAVPSRFESSTDRPIMVEAGTGLLELVLDSAATMPAASVDDEAVAIGDGTIYVTLPTGRHVVEVQGGDARSPVVVDIADRGTSTLVWREEADRSTLRFGPRATDALPPKSLVYLYEWACVVWLVCGLPVAVVNSFSLGETGSVAAVITVAALAAILAIMYPWRRRERARLAEERTDGDSAGLSRVVHFPWDGPAVADRPALLGEFPASLPEFALGRGALMLRLRAHRHLWKEGDGVRVRDAELAGLRVAPPRVRIDGIEQPSTWGNWWYPVRSGKHAVEISFNAAPPRATGPPQWVAERLDVEVREGEAAALRANAHVFAYREDEARGPIRVDEGRLFVDTERFHTDWMDDPAKRIDFWT